MFPAQLRDPNIINCRRVALSLVVIGLGLSGCTAQSAHSSPSTAPSAGRWCGAWRGVCALRSAAAESEADYDQGKGDASTVNDVWVAELGWKHLSRLLAKFLGWGLPSPSPTQSP